MSNDDHVLSTVMHHIISDGWSLDVLMRELAAFYPRLCVARIRFLRCSLCLCSIATFLWQREQAQADEHQKQLSYWVEQLQSSRPAELLCDKPRPAALSGEAGVQSIEIAGPLYATELLPTARRDPPSGLRTPPHRPRDATIGTPNANRDRWEVKDMVGFFVNMQCLRIKIGDESFEELVQQVHEVAVASHANADVPFENIVSKLKNDRDLSRHPLVQLVFAVHAQRDLGQLKLEGVETENLGDTVTSRFDLEFHFSQQRTVCGAAGLHAAAARRRLREAGRDGTRPVEKTAYPRDSSVVDLFREQAAACPSRVAVKDSVAEMTYAQLDAASDVLARWLARRSLAPETLVGCSPAEAAKPFITEALDEQSAEKPGLQMPTTPHGPSATSLAYVMFTSGSTGQPKGVMIYGTLLCGGTLVCIDAAMVLDAEAVLQTFPLFTGLDMLCVGGEAVHLADLRAAEQYLTGKFVNGYGPTENTTFSTTFLVNSGAYVMDSGLRLVPLGVVGELVVTGDGLARGYTDPARNVDRFVSVEIGGKTVRAYRTVTTSAIALPTASWSSSAAWTARSRSEETGWSWARSSTPPQRQASAENIGRDFVGWTSMYDGSDIDKAEMNEWLDDTIATMLNGQRPGNVLEIGSGTGMILFNLGDGLQSYVGLDPSRKAVQFIAETAKSIPGLQDPHQRVAARRRVEEKFDADIYSPIDSVQAENIGRDFVGWTSMYDGSDIDKAEMNEWLDDTIATMLNGQRPGNSYVGLDPSRKAVQFIAETAKSIPGLASKIRMYKATAADVGRLEQPVAASLVVVNSVVQYFPSLDYLFKVQQLVELEAPAPSSSATSGLVRCTESSWPREQCTWQATRPQRPTSVACFFTALPSRLPGLVEHVEILPKKMKATNELSCYRYAAVVHVRPRDGQTQELAIRDSLLQQLKSLSSAPAVAVSNIPTARPLGRDAGLSGLARFGASAGTGLPSLSATELVELAQEVDCRVEISWSRQHSQQGGLDAIFHRYQPLTGERVMFRFPTDHAERPLHSLSSRPLRQQFLQKTQQRLLEMLEAQLPTYMVPQTLAILDAMPVNQNGKVDRKALEQQIDTQKGQSGLKRQPETETQRTMQQLWAGVLAIDADSIGLDDSFFRLGGDSIAAMKLVGEARRAGIHLTVADLFRNPKLECLSRIGRKLLIKFYPPEGSMTRIAFNYFYVEMGPQLDLYLLRNSCRKVLDHLSILRSLRSLDDQWFQIILHDLDLPFSVHDVNESLDEASHAICMQDIERTDPLEVPTSFKVVRYKSTHNRLIIRLSHAQYDGFLFPSSSERSSRPISKSRCIPSQSFQLFLRMLVRYRLCQVVIGENFSKARVPLGLLRNFVFKCKKISPV
ncbi:hypothetical protein P3342_007309 [Pyrenophora teres f. teres]|nr:hypothetical protein P3342_007309 [Pyrenophora teres f. teres]